MAKYCIKGLHSEVIKTGKFFWFVNMVARPRCNYQRISSQNQTRKSTAKKFLEETIDIFWFRDIKVSPICNANHNVDLFSGKNIWISVIRILKFWKEYKFNLRLEPLRTGILQQLLHNLQYSSTKYDHPNHLC